MSNEADQVYQSFLVRCWLIAPATAGEPTAWRFELRDVSAEPEKHRFGDLEQLKASMAAKLAAVAAGSERDGNKEDGRKGDELSQANL